ETGIHIRNSQFLNAMITIERTSNGYGGAYRFVTKHSSGLPNGRAIGNLLWYGSISSASISGAAAKIGVTTTQSWNTSMNGTRLDFWVTPNGSNSLNSSPSMIINQDGSIGVGTVNPTEKVDINGTARLRGLTENNSFSRILAADTNGKLYWRDASTIGDGLGSELITNPGTGNIFVGEDSGKNIVLGGDNNSGFGNRTLLWNTTGYSNTAVGESALHLNTIGGFNSAVGTSSLLRNTTGIRNVAVGSASLNTNTTGDNNVAVGYIALNVNQTGNNNTALGHESGPSSATNLNNTTALGNLAKVTASNQVRIGNASVTSIGGQVSWSTLSDGRFKKNLEEDVHGLDFINSLKPVSYQVDKDKLNDHLGISKEVQAETKKMNATSRRSEGREIGFVAQDVEKAMQETGFQFNSVQAPENESDHYTIRYAEFVVPLVKAVQELSAMVEEQQKVITDLSSKSKEQGSLEDQDNDSTNDLDIELLQNQPNPFTQNTAIRMVLPETVVQADLIIYNLEGKQIQQHLISDRGNTEISLEGGSLQPGMYIYALIADGKIIDQKRMILTK
ncbi:MAG: tail fiber domain-containing protein, partial [Bacteroidota bacterium]